MNWQDISTRASTAPRKNILNSLLWLTGVGFPSGSLAVTFGPWPASLIPFVIGCLPMLAALYYYRHWSNRDPDRLQTEGFNLQREAIAKYGVGSAERTLSIDSTKLVENPAQEIGQ